MKAFFAEKIQKRAGFAAGNDQAIDLVELRRLFYEDNSGAEFFKAATVSVEITLQGEDSDCQSTTGSPWVTSHVRRGGGGRRDRRR